MYYWGILEDHEEDCSIAFELLINLVQGEMGIKNIIVRNRFVHVINIVIGCPRDKVHPMDLLHFLVKVVSQV